MSKLVLLTSWSNSWCYGKAIYLVGVDFTTKFSVKTYHKKAVFNINLFVSYRKYPLKVQLNILQWKMKIWGRQRSWKGEGDTPPPPPPLPVNEDTSYAGRGYRWRKKKGSFSNTGAKRGGRGKGCDGGGRKPE